MDTETLREIRLHLATADERLRRLIRATGNPPPVITAGASAVAQTEALPTNGGNNENR